MTAPLHTQLGEYFASVHADQEPVDVAALVRSRVTAPTEQAAEAGEDLIMVDLETRPDRDTTTGWNSPRWLFPAIAAAALVAAGVVALVLLASSDDEGSAPATRTFDADVALTTAEDFIAARNAGDVEAQEALFAADVAFRTVTDGRTVLTDPDTTRLVMVWDAAQGGRWLSSACVVTSETAGSTVTVTCQASDAWALHLAVDAPPVPTTLVFEVSSGGIERLDALSGQPDYGEVYDQFDFWMATNSPDERGIVECCQWADEDEARRGGELLAVHAAAWAAHLEANDCSYEETAVRPACR